MSKDICFGKTLGEQLVDSGIISGNARRVIIDVSALEPVKLYVEAWGDSRLLAIDWENALKGAEVIRTEDMPDEPDKHEPVRG